MNMKWLAVPVCVAVLVVGCDTNGDSGQVGLERERTGSGPALTGVWGATGVWGSKVSVDVGRRAFNVYFAQRWSLASQCYGVGDGRISAISESYLVLDDLGYSIATGDTVRYDAATNTLLFAGSEPTGQFGWSRLPIRASDIEPLCSTRREQLVGQWELTGMVDGSGDVFPAWEERFSSFVLLIDYDGFGEATATAASGSVSLLSMYVYSGDARGMVLNPRDGTQAKMDFDLEIRADELRLTFAVNSHPWNYYFGTALGDDAVITLVRTSG